MRKLLRENPALCEGWVIVKNKSEILKKAHNFSLKKLKKKMEENIEKTVCKSVQEEEFESGGDKEYEGQEDQKENPFANRKTMKGEARDTLEELKRKLIQNDEWKKEKLEERKRKLIQNAQLRRDKRHPPPARRKQVAEYVGQIGKGQK